MFSEWLVYQTDRQDDVGKFARLAWGDYTSGCSRWFSGAVEWRDHFMNKHSSKVDEIIPLLGSAFRDYAADILKNKAVDAS